MENKIERIKQWFKKPLGIVWFCVAISLFTLIAYHKPLFSYVINNVESGFSGVLIVISFVILLLVFNFMFAMLIIKPLRMVGRVIVAISMLANGAAIYFVSSSNVLLTRDVMGNLFNTRVSEASGFITVGMFLYIIIFGLLPALYVILRKVDYGKMSTFAKSIGFSLLGIIAMALLNINNVLWIDRNATKVGSLIIPWSYVANTARHFHHQRMLNRKEIILPDASFTSDDPSVMVLVIGESARRENFSLYGYERETNPLLKQDSVTTYIANASATSTTQAVKAILDHKRVEKLYEILPNYMYRNGVDVVWRTANWGEPPLHIEKYRNVAKLRAEYPEADSRYDGILLEGLREEIEASTNNKLLIVLHTSTSHGPTYNQKYPTEFEKFTPVCTTVEMAKAKRSELINAYDNTILYTDYLLHSVIEVLGEVEDRACAMIYISDHGESLGEGNIYMHGMVSASMAPKEQTEIPFIVWQGNKPRTLKSLDKVGHYHIFHSVMDYLDMESEFYNEEFSVFE
ncbi:MAG: sulfatase-like hydrolase/transferase [Alistipes sp.]|nr:sulfatase-like hydrolase/transferase [Alistipes sp.]